MKKINNIYSYKFLRTKKVHGYIINIFNRFCLTIQGKIYFKNYNIFLN